MSIVDDVRNKRKADAQYHQAMRLRPRTLREPDMTTYYCDVQTKRFNFMGMKILCAYANGDCRVLAPNGVQFTARAEEVFHIRKGDYHLPPDLD